ncbi:MAG: ABC transporter permease [Dehalococcoidia bacterium]|nr:ABC transporter permease [Dehalococcoidia bacterium]
MKRRRVSLTANPVVRFVKDKPLGAIGGFIVLILLLAGVFANLLAPFSPYQSLPGQFFKPPSNQHLMGTDNLGRDIFSRIIFGARISMVVGICGMLISTSISTTIGITSGFAGGKFDLIVQRFVDGWMAFPLLVILISVMSVVKPGIFQIILVLGIANGISGSRVVRSTVIAMKENVYIEASRAIGCSNTKILIRHIVPNVLAAIIILFTIGMPGLILTEASLSFLGYGIPPPTPSWGGMLSGAGRAYMYTAPWMALWPGLALSIAVYGINVFGDALRDVLDPRLKGIRVSYRRAAPRIKAKRQQVSNSKS